MIIDGVSQGVYLPVTIAGVSEDNYHFALGVTIRGASENIPVKVMNIGGEDIAAGAIPVVNRYATGGQTLVPLEVKQR